MSCLGLDKGVVLKDQLGDALQHCAACSRALMSLKHTMSASSKAWTPAGVAAPSSEGICNKTATQQQSTCEVTQVVCKGNSDDLGTCYTGHSHMQVPQIRSRVAPESFCWDKHQQL